MNFQVAVGFSNPYINDARAVLDTVSGIPGEQALTRNKDERYFMDEHAAHQGALFNFRVDALDIKRTTSAGLDLVYIFSFRQKLGDRRARELIVLVQKGNLRSPP